MNTHAGLILPFLAGAFGVFLMRQFIMGIPDELLDAARVDGAGEYYIFCAHRPAALRRALATLAILTFLASWNSFLWPLVVAATEDMYTLPVAVALFSTGQQETNVGCHGRIRRRDRAGARRLHRAPALLHPGHRHDRHQVG